MRSLDKYEKSELETRLKKSKDLSEWKLTAEESEKLEKHLVERTDLKVKNIVAYVKEEFNKKYSRIRMTAW